MSHAARLLAVSVLGLVVASGASATSVNLIFVGGTSAVLSGLGTSSVGVQSGATATLTMDIQLDIDSDGVSAAFLSLLFDTDLGDELDVVSFSELSWSNAKGTRTLTQLNGGIQSSIESTSLTRGQLFTFEASSLGTGPKNTTLTFARVVFSTNTIVDDGDDIFSGIFNDQSNDIPPGPKVDVIGNNAGTPIDDLVNFGGASVNIAAVPEPGTTSILAVSLGVLMLAGARRR